MHLGKLGFGLVLAATLFATGCCSSKWCGGRPAATVSAFPPPRINRGIGCPDGNCGTAPPVAAAPVQVYSAPPAAVIPNGYAR